MFKTRNCKQRKQSKRKTDNKDIGSDDVDEVDTASSLQEQLEAAKKRRTLIHHLQHKRGVDANDLLMKPTEIVKLYDTSAAPTELLPNNMASSELEGRVWEQKHAAAMEEFVQNQLKTKEYDWKLEEIGVKRESITSKEELYRDLAARAAVLSGKSIDAAGAAVEDSSKDVLTAGAATAMAEVILPVSDRLLVVAETARAAGIVDPSSSRNHHRPAVAGIVVHKSNNPAVPNRFRSSYTHHHHPLTGGKHQQQKDEEPKVEGAVDDERLGFAAARQHQQKSNNKQKGNGNTRSSDDRVYQQFVRRQREQQGR